MCGIAGQLSIDGSPPDRRLVRRMASTLALRGPDDEGFYFDDRIGLGHRRLSIIDLDAGSQPIGNEDGSIWVVSNSEIYNFKELRALLIKKGHRFSTKGDTEIIVHLYEEYGENFVEKLVGMFAFALWDKRKKKLLLVRDKFGIKPLYYFLDRHHLLFASEIKGILQYSALEKRLNYSALDDYFSFLYSAEPKTIFDNIHKLSPAHYLVYAGEKMTIRKYWDLNFDYGTVRPEKYYKEGLRRSLTESVKLALRSDVPVGVFLSGGIDSSVVSAVAKRLSNKSLKTFSVAFKEAPFNEAPFSRVVAEALNTNHHELLVTKEDAVRAIQKITAYLDEPFGDASCIPTYCLSEFARKSVKVVLTGDGSDELLAGYGWHTQNHEGTRSSHYSSKPISEVFYDEGGKAKLYSADLRKAVSRFSKLQEPETCGREWRRFSSLDKKLYTDIKTYLPSDILLKVDRMSMMNSLEARPPYLNDVYVDFVTTLPTKMKYKKGIGKYLLKKVFERDLPSPVIARKKMGFAIPMNLWLWEDGAFRDLVYDVLLDSKTRSRGIFNDRYVAHLLDQHSKLKQINGYQIWLLFMFELWQRKFIDN